MATTFQGREQTPESIAYAAAWRTYAQRRHAALFLLMTWLPLCLGIFVLSGFAARSPGWSMSLAAVWLALALGAVWWAGEFRCPRCQRRYGALGDARTSNILRGLFDRTCPNCKLTKFDRRA